jgi:transposase
MLKYKSGPAAVWFDEVNESYSTQECSACHARTGPKGLAGLGARQWTCIACKAEHDRDTNAALNILASTPSGGLHRRIAIMEGSTSDTAARAPSECSCT